jgi:hypothetical protein
MAYTIYPRRGGLHEQVYLLSREFRRRGYNVYILYYRHGLIDKSHVFRIPLYLSGIHPKLYSSINKCDYVIMETVWPWLAAIPIRLMGKDFVLHIHSIESLSEFGLPLHKRIMIKLAEEIAGRLARTIVTVSLTDYSILKTRFNNKVVYIPLAIDLEEREKYTNMNRGDIRKLLNLPTNKLIITFVGGMGYGANREAAKIITTQIAPKVHEITNGQALFLLIGPDPPPEAIRLSYVKTTGYVRSIAPYIAASDVCIAPIYKGGGVKMKVLDYMTLEKPVIATRKAVEGLPIEPWIHYIPAETPEEFVEKIIEATENIEHLSLTIGKASYEYVTKHHSAELVTQKFFRELENG